MDVTVSMLLQTFEAATSPPEGEGLGRYLDAVIRAAGLRTDADLARLMNVSPSIIASWRRRQVVTKAGQTWLQENLVKLASRRQTYLFNLDFEAMTVMEVLRRTQVDPLGLGPDNLMAAEALPPLLALADVIFSGVLHVDLDKDEQREHRVADLLVQVLPTLRRRLAPSPKGAQ